MVPHLDIVIVVVLLLVVFLERIVSDNAYGKIPVVRLLFTPALYWWLLFLYMVTAFYRKRYREALPAVFLAAYCLTLLLSPTVRLPADGDGSRHMVVLCGGHE